MTTTDLGRRTPEQIRADARRARELDLENARAGVAAAPGAPAGATPYPADLLTALAMAEVPGADALLRVVAGDAFTLDPMALLCAALSVARQRLEADCDADGTAAALVALTAHDVGMAEAVASRVLHGAPGDALHPADGAAVRMRKARGVETHADTVTRLEAERAGEVEAMRQRYQDSAAQDDAREREQRRNLLWEPAERERLALALGGRTQGDRAVKVPCPSCGRRSVFFYLDPNSTRQRVTGARCGHANSCGWGGSITTLAGLG